MLHFIHRNEHYIVNERGELAKDRTKFTENWLFLGVSFHHRRKSLDVFVRDEMDDPTKLIGGIVWDEDHGIIRSWREQYCGKLPRITTAWIE